MFLSVTIGAAQRDRSFIFSKLAAKYVECMKDMDGRAPGGLQSVLRIITLKGIILVHLIGVSCYLKYMYIPLEH